MATQVRMPQLSAYMTEGVISKWLKQEGEPVTQEQPLYEVVTDKAVNEVDSPATGVLKRIIVPQGGSVPVQALIAIIAEPSEDLPAEGVVAGEAKTTEGQVIAGSVGPGAKPAAASPLASPVDRLVVSPRARKLAEEHRIDLTLLKGSGPGGRIVERDVEEAARGQAQAATASVAPTAPAAPPVAVPPVPVVSEYRAVRMAGIRKTIAERMSRSQETTAHVTLSAEVGMGEAAKLREQANAEWANAQHLRMTYTDMVVKAAAKALREFPRINSTLVDGEIREYRAVNVGFAVAVADGLIVPVIRDADQKSLRDISRALRDLSDRARKGTLRADEVTGGTFTVTNMGMMGVEMFTPIINWPECAILGVGRISDRAVVLDGQVSIRPMMWLSLTFDHRIADGAPAAAFLARVKELLESPYLLLV